MAGFKKKGVEASMLIVGSNIRDCAGFFLHALPDRAPTGFSTDSCKDHVGLKSVSNERELQIKAHLTAAITFH